MIDRAHARAWLARVLSVFAFAISLPALAQTGNTTPVEAFFQNRAYNSAKLSPNARHVAITVAGKGERTRLVVLDIEKRALKVVANFSDADVGRFEWVNNDRLVFLVVDRESAQGDATFPPGLCAVDRDGNDFRQLTARTAGVIARQSLAPVNLLGANARLLATTRDKSSDDVFVTLPVFQGGDWFATNVHRLDTRTGKSSSFTRPGQTGDWVIDAKDVPRVAKTYEGDRAALHYLDPADGQWRKLAEYSRFDGAGGISPVAIGPDGTLFVAANRGDKRELFRYDLEKKAIDGQPLVTLAGYDFDGQLVMDKKRVLGVQYRSDAPGTLWFDAQAKAIQSKVDAALPATVNQLDIPLSPELPYVLVHSFSDVDPGTFLLYQTETQKLLVLGQAMTGIDPKQMASKDLVRYKARDGLEIPAWLTVPKGGKGKKLPMVVLAHGGPWIRGGDWEWSADSQFLASRGYVVLEPEFRGSAGFGLKHFTAGWKQWGRAMQDDLADGTKWAIEQGIADPQRICIAGASYGGYATLMGLVNDPDLYRCGVNWVGVTDIDLMYSVAWSDLSTTYKTYGMPILVGDKVKDAEQLRKTSPLLQAERIKQPVLLAYGGHDRRVPIVHGIKFRDAVQKTNPAVEWIEYTDEGHGWYLVKNRVDFWTRVEKFLARHIGTP